jgi:hypothetical protein
MQKRPAIIIIASVLLLLTVLLNIFSLVFVIGSGLRFQLPWLFVAIRAIVPISFLVTGLLSIRGLWLQKRWAWITGNAIIAFYMIMAGFTCWLFTHDLLNEYSSPYPVEEVAAAVISGILMLLLAAVIILLHRSRIRSLFALKGGHIALGWGTCIALILLYAAGNYFS